MYLKQFGLYVAMICVIAFTGCHKNEIQLQTVTQTSEKLNCEKILLQTGTVDNDFLQAAIIHAGNKEILLNLDNAQKQGNSVTEIYKGKGFKVILTYKPEQFTHASGYKGFMEIWKGSKHYKFAVQGIDNIL